MKIEKTPSMPAATDTRKELFLKACRFEPVERVPVWIMRQAGRYLPEYRRIRERHSFLEICKTPELAAEVSLQPFRRLGVDAIIVFSDILIVAEAMGVPLEVPDGGPVLGRKIRDEAGVRALKDFDPLKETRFVGEAIARLADLAGPEVPILGFAGAPWTLACYLIQGQTRGELAHAKQMMYSHPPLMKMLLEGIAHATARYLRMQIEAGAAAVQLFDTWAGELTRSDYQEFALPANQLLVRELNPGATPVILYARGAGHLLDDMAMAGAQVLSVDWRVDLKQARNRLGNKIALQGNVDPAILLGPEAGVRAAVMDALQQTGGAGHILNLGHGILPVTPVENAMAFVDAAKTTSGAASVAARGSQGPSA
jgi:uroporphyrinogen decarboxylase